MRVHIGVADAVLLRLGLANFDRANLKGLIDLGEVSRRWGAWTRRDDAIVIKTKNRRLVITEKERSCANDDTVRARGRVREVAISLLAIIKLRRRNGRQLHCYRNREMIAAGRIIVSLKNPGETIMDRANRESWRLCKICDAVPE